MTTISGNNVLYTASNLVDSIGGLIQRTPTANSSDTLPTAADIITSFTGSNVAGNVGQSFVFTIYNNSAFVITINTNTGVSLIDGATTDSICPQCTRMYTVIQTAVSAVMIYMIGNASVSPETNTDIYLASGRMLVGNASNVATSVTMSGDSTINNAGALTLATVNGAPASTTLSSITTNGKGLVTSNTTGNLTGDVTSTGLSTTYGNIVPLTKGGTNNNLTASNGGIFYSTATTGAILSGTATAGQILRSGASSAPSWSTATYPATTTINRILYSSATNTINEITTANGGVLITSSTGIPSWSSTMTNGQVIIGSTGASPVAASLTAGSGISITPGAGTITIATTGGSGTVTSVSGTTNRITISGTPTVAPVVDIASTYVGQTSITTLGTIASGTWNGNVMGSTYGGTGVNNGSNTITLGGNLTTSGAFTTTLIATANTNVTLPTSGTLMNNTLSNANIFVGNASNVATGVPMAGDVTLANNGDVTVTQVNGTAISIGTAFLLNLTINRPITTINTTATATAVQWVYGIIESTPTGTFNLTTPTAAQIVSYIPSASVGMTFNTTINNVANASRTITIVNGTGVSRFGNITIQLVDANPISGRYFMTIYSIITNVTPGSETVVMYPG